MNRLALLLAALFLAGLYACNKPYSCSCIGSTDYVNKFKLTAKNKDEAREKCKAHGPSCGLSSEMGEPG